MRQRSVGRRGGPRFQGALALKQPRRSLPPSNETPTDPATQTATTDRGAPANPTLQTVRKRAVANVKPGRTAKERGMPGMVMLFFVALLIPTTLSVGPLALSPIRALLLISFLPLLFMLLRGRAGPINIVDVLVAGSVAWAGLALVLTDPARTPERFGVFTLEMLGSYLFARLAVRSSADFTRFAWISFVIVGVLAVFAAHESLTGQPLLRRLFPYSGGSTTAGGPRLGLRRAQTVFDHPILYGCFVAGTLGICWYTLSPRAPFIYRCGIAFVIAVATFFSLSAGALIPYLLQSAMIAWDTVLRTIRDRWKVLLGGLVALYVLFSLFAESSLFNFVLMNVSFNKASAYNRVLIYEWGFVNLWNNPIFGLGFKHENWLRADWMVSSMDALFLVWVTQYGIPMILMYFGAVVILIRRVTRAPLVSVEDKACRTGYLISLIGLILGGVTVHYWQTMLCFFMFLMGSGVWMISGGADDDPAEDAPNQQRGFRTGSRRPGAAPLPEAGLANRSGTSRQS